MIPSYHFEAFALMLERENVDASCCFRKSLLKIVFSILDRNEVKKS
jgi:hypothetical protein